METSRYKLHCGSIVHLNWDRLWCTNAPVAKLVTNWSWGGGQDWLGREGIVGRVRDCWEGKGLLGREGFV